MAASYMTDEGYKKLVDEIQYLESVKRPEVIQQIAEARDKGDLSENAEYDAAKEAQGMLEARIARLKALFSSARIIDQSKVTTDEIQIMSKITIKNVVNGQTMVYTIVPESEANVREGKLSVSTPIAQGLMGKKLGETAKVKVPSGIMEFEVVDISI